MATLKPEVQKFVHDIVSAIVTIEIADGLAPDNIATKLNAQGLRTRNGRPWDSNTVKKLLSSPQAMRIRDELLVPPS